MTPSLLPCCSHLKFLALMAWTKFDQFDPSPGNSTRQLVGSSHLPRLWSLLAVPPWTRHLCRPCHIASNGQPPPVHRRTVPVVSSSLRNRWQFGRSQAVSTEYSVTQAQRQKIGPCAVIIWPAWTFSKCFINSSCGVLQLAVKNQWESIEIRNLGK